MIIEIDFHLHNKQLDSMNQRTEENHQYNYLLVLLEITKKGLS